MYNLSKKIILDNKNKFILFPEGIIKLNDTAFDILNECKNKNLSQIKESISNKYGNNLEIQNDVELFLKDALKNKYITKK